MEVTYTSLGPIIANTYGSYHLAASSTVLLSICNGLTRVRKSVNQGVTWTDATPYPSSIPSIDWIFYTGGAFYVKGNYSTALARSIDNGSSWSLITLPVGGFWSLPAVSPTGTLVTVADSSTSLAVSTDNGVTWQPKILPLVSSWRAVCYSGDKLCVFAYDKATPMYFSGDNGGSWQRGSVTGSGPAMYSAGVYGTSIIVGDGTYPGPAGFSLSTDSGVTWAYHNTPVGGSHRTLWICMVGGTALATDFYNGMYIVEVTTGTTTVLPYMANISSMPCVVGNTVYLVGDSNRLSALTFGGFWDLSAPPFWRDIINLVGN